ncbi:hypothetical protein E3N88_12412 [Mikania micrantha]|uniref:Uncharacterized protein n=1 Tax=Mikania micrantha TaxID=192012 RepID=A0A5N6P5T0_9ASTR|nr:hypothetical protein E3N88_12412 [Mikania micrantha]
MTTRYRTERIDRAKLTAMRIAAHIPGIGFRFSLQRETPSKQAARVARGRRESQARNGSQITTSQEASSNREERDDGSVDCAGGRTGEPVGR